MAFDRKGFNTIADMGVIGTTTIRLHTYVTNDDAAAVQTSGYFNAMAYLLNTGDRIMVQLDVDGTEQARNYTVTKTGSVITVTNMQATAIP